jgi:hypothetical protein
MTVFNIPGSSSLNGIVFNPNQVRWFGVARAMRGVCDQCIFVAIHLLCGRLVLDVVHAAADVHSQPDRVQKLRCTLRERVPVCA